VAIALPQYGPASFFQRTGGRCTPADRARTAAAEASPGFQHRFISGRIAAGAWLWIGEQVSWCTGVRTPRSSNLARATYEWCTSPESTLIEAGGVYAGSAPTEFPVAPGAPNADSGEERAEGVEGAPERGPVL
jgi:hypothetical protein